MKEMVYKNRKKFGSIILDEGFYKNYEYFIINRHTHPCSYVCIDNKSVFFKKEYNEIPLECHGGLTYSEPVIHSVMQYSDKYKCDINTTIDREWVIGWDYAHFEDYMGYEDPFFNKGKRWTTLQLKEEVEQVIDDLIEKEKEYFKRYLVKELQEQIYEYCCDYDDTIKIDSWEELHDWALNVSLNGIKIEDDDELYEKMVKITKENAEEMIYDINDFIEEECQSYYGDPAFASAYDYWSYILG